VEIWAKHGGNLGLLCTNPKVASLGLKGLFGEKIHGIEEDVLDSVPVIVQADDDFGAAEEEVEEEGEVGATSGPMAEGVETGFVEVVADGVSEVKGTAGWWDSWWGDVEYEGTVGEVDEEIWDAEEIEDVFDLEDIMDELLLRGSTGKENAYSSLVKLESLMADEDDKAGDLIPAGPVAESFADSAKSALLSNTGKTGGDKKSGFLGNVMAAIEPTLDITDPFLLDGEYQGTPEYMQGIDLARNREEDIKALCDKVGVHPRLNVGNGKTTLISELLELRALSKRFIFIGVSFTLNSIWSVCILSPPSIYTASLLWRSEAAWH
jgi:hypothetical protein